MITFNTKEESSKFTKELQSYLDNEFNPIIYTEYVKLNKGPEYDFSVLSPEEVDILLNTPATQEPYENILIERFNEVALEMFLLSNPN
jgi:hypothetical protein